MNEHGFVKIAVCSPKVAIGDPSTNAASHWRMLNEMPSPKASFVPASADIVLFPELSITGYTCGDLFKQDVLLKAAERAVADLSQWLTKSSHGLVIVGVPVPVGNQLFNCAIAINCKNGSILGIVPKQNIPTYKEFYESRWFRGGKPHTLDFISFAGQTRIPFGTDILFKYRDAVVGIEICEDLWMPIPPSSALALAGANVLVNLSASPETVGKNEYRSSLVEQQSGRCVAAYAYAAANRSESTDDLVFGGPCMVAENGSMLKQTEFVGCYDNPLGKDEGLILVDVDVQKMQNERRESTSFGEASKALPYHYHEVAFDGCDSDAFDRAINPHPFVPSDPKTLSMRCCEVFGIQCAGLYGRMEKLNWPDVYLGVSGGLDSTLTALAAVRTFATKGLSPKKIHGTTMPGFGTTLRTKDNSITLMQNLGIDWNEFDIRPACVAMFIGMKHDPFGCGWLAKVLADHSAQFEGDQVVLLEKHLAELTPEQIAKGDLKFENVQARVRTLYLMSRGFVLGTGDMSESALGWCTYNGDHMSMYNVNCSIPKTLVKFLVEWVANHEVRKIIEPGSADVLPGSPILERRNLLTRTLMSIASTVISPELLPKGRNGQIAQSTEDLVGPYELHDFFLFHFVRNGFSPDKILWLSGHAKFDKPYTYEFRKATLVGFIKRFFSQQFKRNCVPNGPKVGSVSLSPRGDWRMPSDATASAWLKNLGINL
jgi:NAD+ synthase (glutamine-hydrolysing)